MAQPEPLTTVYDNCLRRILKSIQDYPKKKTDFYTMIALEMHKTGILGGRTTNLEERKMDECFGVADEISWGEGIIPKMKTDPENLKECLLDVDLLIAEKKIELEEKDPDIFPLMEKCLDLIARLTDCEKTAADFCADGENIKKICAALSEMKHIPELCDGVLRVIENLTRDEPNLVACKEAGVHDAMLDLAEDEVEDLLES